MSENTKYLTDEARWMLSFRTNPLDIAKALHVQPASFYRLARRHGMTDISKAFAPYSKVTMA